MERDSSRYEKQEENDGKPPTLLLVSLLLYGKWWEVVEP
jgi:hypothetical protein